MDLSVFIAELRSLLGEPPAGFEWLEYVFAAVFLMFLVSAAISLISAVLRFVRGDS